MYRLICQKPAHFLSAQMALVSTFFSNFIVCTWDVCITLGKLLIDHNTVNNLVAVAGIIQWIAVRKKDRVQQRVKNYRMNWMNAKSDKYDRQKLLRSHRYLRKNLNSDVEEKITVLTLRMMKKIRVKIYRIWFCYQTKHYNTI